MRYFNLPHICFYIFFIFFLLLILYSHLIFEIKFNNKNIVIKLKVKLLFKLIRLNFQLYPLNKKKTKKKRIGFKDLIILDKELINIINLIKKVKIIELYSNIYFGHVNPYITIYINTLINGLYGNIIKICKCEKIYLNIEPKFTENNIKGSVKIHIKFRFISMSKAIPILIRIIKLKYKSKEGDKNDSHKFNTKHYGDNS